jgi:hypothetical protein
MVSPSSDESRRTSPLALWRYAHDYLRAARSLSRQHQIACSESQAAHHVAAQGIEFALLAFLTARGASLEQVRRDVGRSLYKALARSESMGLPPIPSPWRAAVAEIAPCHQDTQFVYLAAPENTFPDLDPVVDAGIFILDRIAPDVAVQFVIHLGDSASPSVETFVRRLRADLSATSDIVGTRADDEYDLPMFEDFSVSSAAPHDRRADS